MQGHGNTLFAAFLVFGLSRKKGRLPLAFFKAVRALPFSIWQIARDAVRPAYFQVCRAILCVSKNSRLLSNEMKEQCE